MLQPAAKGGTYTITATTTTTASGSGIHSGARAEVTALERVTFGDVYLCSGQSNIALEVRSVHGGNFDISSKHFPRCPQLFTAPRAPCDAPCDYSTLLSAHADWMLIGACNPMS